MLAKNSPGMLSFYEALSTNEFKKKNFECFKGIQKFDQCVPANKTHISPMFNNSTTLAPRRRHVLFELKSRNVHWRKFRGEYRLMWQHIKQRHALLEKNDLERLIEIDMILYTKEEIKAIRKKYLALNHRFDKNRSFLNSLSVTYNAPQKNQLLLVPKDPILSSPENVKNVPDIFDVQLETVAVQESVVKRGDLEYLQAGQKLSDSVVDLYANLLTSSIKGIYIFPSILPQHVKKNPPWNKVWLCEC